MKNEVNRALVAKKKNYINPSVQVAQFASMGLMQAALLTPWVFTATSPANSGKQR